MFNISYYSLSSAFYHWGIIIFVGSYHPASIEIWSASGSKCFNRESPMCVLILPPLKPLQINHIPGNDTKYLASFWNCSTKVSCQASDPLFLVTERNIFFPSDVFWCRISSITVYLHRPQDTLLFRMCTTCSSTIPTWHEIGTAEFELPSVDFVCKCQVVLQTANELCLHLDYATQRHGISCLLTELLNGISLFKIYLLLWWITAGLIR